jgi:fluoroacetyl-CoA thioesterase
MVQAPRARQCAAKGLTRPQTRTSETGDIEETIMKPGLKPGASHVNRIHVDRDRTIDFMGEEARVYGTPFLVRDIEQTCRQLLLQYADAGEDSVGMEIALKHLAPTLLGMEVEITATVAAVDGRKIGFEPPRISSSRSAPEPTRASWSTSPRPTSG